MVHIFLKCPCLVANEGLLEEKTGILTFLINVPYLDRGDAYTNVCIY